MSGCVVPLLALALAVFVLLSVLRWFEQITEAVDSGWWNKVAMLIVVPFATWLYPSRVSAGRPTAVPHHEPVRGFGVSPTHSPAPTSPSSAPETSPPPGTPAEFIGPPKIPPPKPTRAAVDPEKIAKLRQKMKEQGMLGEEE
jgi:hypothetical protein